MFYNSFETLYDFGKIALRKEATFNLNNFLT